MKECVLVGSLLCLFFSATIAEGTELLDGVIEPFMTGERSFRIKLECEVELAAQEYVRAKVKIGTQLTRNKLSQAIENGYSAELDLKQVEAFCNRHRIYSPGYFRNRKVADNHRQQPTDLGIETSIVKQ